MACQQRTPAVILKRSVVLGSNRLWQIVPNSPYVTEGRPKENA